jgi:CRP-like cAMP-binding protein
VIFKEGDDGNELFILHEGCVRVALNTRSSDGTVSPGTINMLYSGQSFGEMVLLGGATRSATITCVEPCTLLVLREPQFASLCESNPRIGFLVMRNLAMDLSYKLRSSNLLLRGNIRWQHGELGKK